MRIYKDNTDVKKELETILIEVGSNKAKLGETMGISRQRVSNILNKKNLSFADIASMCDAMECDLYIDIVPREKDQK